MSDEDRDLARIRAWDQYQKAKTTCAAHRHKLSGWADKFSETSQSLRSPVDDLTGEEMATIPNASYVQKAIADYKAAVHDLQSAQATARQLGWDRQVDE